MPGAAVGPEGPPDRGRPGTPGTNEPPTERGADTGSSPTRSVAGTVGRWLVAGLALLVGLTVAQELLSRGTSGVSGLSVANYRAVAKIDGDPAPPIELPALGGSGTISLADFRGKVVVLNFWASWCLPCRKEAPDLQAAWRDYREQGVQFLGVNYRDNEAAAQAFVDEFHITYPSAADAAGSLADDYGLLGFPTTFIIGPDGRMIYRFMGYLDGPVLRKALDEVLKSP